MSLAKLAWLMLLHWPWTKISLLRYVLFRRRGVLVLTHAADVDRNGVDNQMGPLVAALEERSEPIVHVVLTPLSAEGFFEQRSRTGGFLSLGALFGAARLLAPFLGGRRKARARVAGWVLSLCAPRACYLIDESGSGQMWISAARERGIPSIGIQHGDFAPDNHQYAPRPGEAFEVEPADCLCLWSPWFQERLFAISPIYDSSNTFVTGRLAHARSEEREEKKEPEEDLQLRILLISEADAGFEASIGRYLSALRSHDEFELRVRPHPSEDKERWPPSERTDESLDRLLETSDLLVGVSSSALLEGLRVGRPVLLLGSDPSGFVAGGAAELCSDPSELPRMCLELGRGPKNLPARERVWGGVPADTISLIMEQSGLS